MKARKERGQKRSEDAVAPLVKSANSVVVVVDSRVEGQELWRGYEWRG